MKRFSNKYQRTLVQTWNSNWTLTKDINIYVDDELTNQLSTFVVAHEDPLPKVKYVHDS
jgi:hypothetical protein